MEGPKARGGADMRFTTEEIMKLRHRPSKDALNKIKEVCNKCEVVKFNGQSYILFDMDHENPCYMMTEAINVILGAPKGTDSNAMSEVAGTELVQLLRALFVLGPKDRITNDHILSAAEYAKKCDDVNLEVTCFFLLLFNRLLNPALHSISMFIPLVMLQTWNG